MTRRYSKWGPPPGVKPWDVTTWGQAVGGCTGSYLVMLLGFGMSFTLPVGPWIFLAGLLGGFVSFAYAASLPRRNRERLLAGRMLALEADGGEAAVRVTYALAEGGQLLGTDEGALCTEDGWLLYRGERTEWAVRAEDVEPGGGGFRYVAPGGGRFSVSVDAPFEPGRLSPIFAEWRTTAPRPALPTLPPIVVAPERADRDARVFAVWGVVGLLLMWLLSGADAGVRWTMGAAFVLTALPVLGTRLSDRRALRRSGAWPNRAARSLPASDPGDGPQ